MEADTERPDADDTTRFSQVEVDTLLKIARTLEHLDELDDPFFGETPHVLTHPRFEELDD